jgi:exo-beta-1,3-glucanase (GH17 family)
MTKPFSLPLYLISLLVSAALLTGYWCWQGRPVMLPDVAGVDHKLQCVSYSPFDKDQSPLTLPIVLRPHRIDTDLDLLAQYFSCVRTYSMTGMEDLPALARKHGLKLMLGAWVSTDPVATQQEIDLLVAAANLHPDIVTSVIVGNEALLRKEITGKNLAALIEQVKQRVLQPVTYADVWEFWEKHPEVAPVVDFITIHLLPYWEDDPAGIDAAIAKVTKVREHYEKLFAPKDIFIGETGWPSEGRQRETAVPSRINEAKFMREFVTLAEQRGWQYNLIEAFDQPWKRANEGAVGGYWGLFDADRNDKSILAGSVSDLPEFRLWLYASAGVMALGLIALGKPRDARAGLIAPALAALAGGCLAAWWVQASYASRDAWEWMWAVLLSLLNAAILLHAMLHLSTREHWRSRLFALLDARAPLLLLGAGFVGALLSIQLGFDARYRLFSPCLILLPALWFAIQPVAIPAAQARLLGGIIALSLPWLLWQETPANVQALAWIAAAAVLVLALWRGQSLRDNYL